MSLLLQENTQSVIIKKLNSHTRYARLRKALYEYNNLLRSLHVLNMIEDIELRKAVKTARNRTESYHQLQKIIRNMYQGVYRSGKASNNAVCTQSVCLVSNMIVAYNATILNTIYENMKNNGAFEKELERFLRISPMSWVHIGLTGKYTFGSDEDHNITATILNLEKSLIKFGITSGVKAA
jgi:TnpA family transposase